MALLKIPMPGYLNPGSLKRLWWIGDCTGNANYQQNGDTFYATDFGMAGFETASPEFGGFTASNNYYVKVKAPTTMNSNEVVAPAYNNITLVWYYAANNVQVANNTNLSIEIFRFSARGV
jgi:hypothetical protein